MPKVILQSFDSKSLKKIDEQEPDIPLIQLYSAKNESMLSKRRLRKVAAYASGIGVDKTIVTEDLVELAHSVDLHVHPFTVNDEVEIRRHDRDGGGRDFHGCPGCRGEGVGGCARG